MHCYLCNRSNTTVWYSIFYSAYTRHSTSPSPVPHSCTTSSLGWCRGCRGDSTKWLPELMSCESLSWKRSRSTRKHWTQAHPETTSTASSLESVRYSIVGFINQNKPLVIIKYWVVQMLRSFEHYVHRWTHSSAFEHPEFLRLKGSNFCPFRKSTIPQLSSTMTTWCPQCWTFIWQEQKPPAQLSDLH